ncbi:serine/threonine-protein kinase [Henriciella litoralis]|uniref:serine/threonine-protein kinase n=1 Tax=Henriciella litoralis TaxID=568102 RepID=UPI0009FC554C|nr:serine/threonine-protein kinase [Henriciella litoralis]
MNAEERSRWSRLDAAFARALDCPESERFAWLESEYADDPETLMAVRTLLRREADSRHRFDHLFSLRDSLSEELADHLGESNDDPRIGALYGPWRVIRRIAAGGLSVVYEACRSDGRYEQHAALKVMHGGLHSVDAVRHFLRERRILSTLDHPGIVRILDGGETATGAPWLVMDLASGTSITTYCDANALSLNARLTLVAEIADAVQSAHARLVVHRDIKPENVIVSPEGRPRLLDFGVSSLLAGEVPDEPGHAMTPDYASPEQRRLEPVTTASDVWQLGRLLDEICEGFHPLPRDVLAVIRKATAEQIEDRYESASGFAADLRKLVQGEAPLASPDGRLRAALRFARRNTAITLLGILMVCGLVGWAVTSSLQTLEIRRERALAVAAADRAERGRDILLNLFRRLDPLEQDGVSSVDTSTATLVEPTLADVRERLPDDPFLRAELVGWAARIRQRDGNLDEARALAQESVDVLRQSGDTASTTYAAALAYLGHLDMLLGAPDVSEAEISEALEIAIEAPLDDAAALDAMLSAIWANESDWQHQRELLEAALPRTLATGSANAEIEVRSGLGRVLSNLGLLAEGEAEARAALAIAEDVYGPTHPRLTLPLSDLGRILFSSGQAEEAVATHRRAEEIATAAYGALSEEVLSHRNNLALALSAAGREDEAIAELQAVITILESVKGPDSRAVGEALQNLAAEQSTTGQLEQALASLDRAEPILMQTLPAQNPRRGFPALTRSAVLLDLQRYREARTASQQAFDILSATLPDGHYAVEIARCRMGMADLGMGNEAEAASLLSLALKALEQQPSAPGTYVAQCREAGSKLGIVE